MPAVLGIVLRDIARNLGGDYGGCIHLDTANRWVLRPDCSDRATAWKLGGLTHRSWLILDHSDHSIRTIGMSRSGPTSGPSCSDSAPTCHLRGSRLLVAVTSTSNCSSSSRQQAMIGCVGPKTKAKLKVAFNLSSLKVALAACRRVFCRL